MYKIKIKDDRTGEIWNEYGFSKYIMEGIYNYFNEKDEDNYSIYDILSIEKLKFSIKNFKKCLTKASHSYII